VVLPVALMPDAAWGISGRLRPADFPESWSEAREVVADADHEGRGDVLLLPLSSYRQPAWLDGRKVLDPMGRFLTPDYVASDELLVSATTIPGEDPRVLEVQEALQLETPELRAGRLAALGIGYVVLEPDVKGPAPEITGQELLDRSEVHVTALENARQRDVPATWWVALAVAWLAFVTAPVLGLRLWWRRTRVFRR
jgi:hypothetical protein